MTLVDHQNDRLTAALSGLTDRGVLSTEQADAVRVAYDATDIGAVDAQAARPSALRGWLVEGAAYLGALLVSASLLVIAAQRWSDLSYAQHLALLLVLGAACVVVGAAVVRSTPGGRSGLREPARAARCRVASVALSLASVLFAAALAVGVGEHDWTLTATASLALVLLVVAHLVAPSVVTDVAMFAATVTVVGSSVTQLVPLEDHGGEDFGQGNPPAQLRDYVLSTALVATGLLWAVVVSPRLVVPRLGVVLGSVVAFEAALPAAGNESTRWWGLVLLAVLAGVGILMLLRSRFWAWLVLSLLSVTAFVFILVGQRAGAATAFLVAGLVLLAGAFGGSRLSRRRTG